MPNRIKNSATNPLRPRSTSSTAGHAADRHIKDQTPHELYGKDGFTPLRII